MHFSKTSHLHSERRGREHAALWSLGFFAFHNCFTRWRSHDTFTNLTWTCCTVTLPQHSWKRIIIQTYKHNYSHFISWSQNQPNKQMKWKMNWINSSKNVIKLLPLIWKSHKYILRVSCSYIYIILLYFTFTIIHYYVFINSLSLFGKLCSKQDLNYLFISISLYSNLYYIWSHFTNYTVNYWKCCLLIALY